MALPEGFLWGTASASTSVEGAAPRSDWARWEADGHAPRSGEGNGFGTEYARDFAMLAEHGLPHHRLVLEWARLEPEQGRHDPLAVEHYQAVLRSARDHGVRIWAGLHHVSLPGWFSTDLGGFRDDHDRRYWWPRHVEWVAEVFGDDVAGWVPVNQPVAWAEQAYRTGAFPPGSTDDDERWAEALRGALLANHEAWRILSGGDAPVATAMDLQPVEPAVRGREPDERDRAGEQARHRDAVVFGSWTRALRDGILAVPGRPEEEVPDMAGSFDLVGVVYAAGASVYADGTLGPYPADARVGPLGSAPWPEGLGVGLRRLHDALPGRRFLVAACGFGTDDDAWRRHLVKASVDQVVLAVDDGVDVAGYFHRTAVDGYEWNAGFTVPFGLFDRDRSPRGSAEVARDLAG